MRSDFPYKFGWNKSPKDSRTLMLANYLAPSLPVAPVNVNWSGNIKAPMGMMLNDRLGDCTIAAYGHLVQTWTSFYGEVTIPDNEILSAYEACSGYNGQSDTDTGCEELDVLKYCISNGIGGHKIDSFAKINVNDIDEVKQSINLFGGIYIGIALPLFIENLERFGSEWSGPNNLTDHANVPGGCGGHAVCVVGYDANRLDFISWGSHYYMDWPFWVDYVEEAYALLSCDWAPAGKTAPDGVNFDNLQADLRLVR